jgi:hypothetical protein
VALDWPGCCPRLASGGRWAPESHRDRSTATAEKPADHQNATWNASASVAGWAAIMALAMVVTRVAVTAFRAVRATEGIPWAERRAIVGRRPRHTHLHHHAY